MREVAPPEAQADTAVQAVERGLSAIWRKAKDLGHQLIDDGVPASEPSPGEALTRALRSVAAMVESAAPDPLAAEVRPAPLADWLGPPTGTPWFKALWEELTVRQELARPAWLQSAEERRGVERQFMALWRLFCASPEGQALEAEVKAAIKSDGEHLWDHLARHYAGWGRRHVFGNLSEFNEAEGVVFMPLEDVYVEPWVRREENVGDSEPTKALSTLRDAASQHRLTVVSGAMGFGKTLTARMLVTEWAEDWREAQKPLSERWMPVYVSCRERLKGVTGLTSLISETVRAYWREISGDDPEEEDTRLSPPDDYRLVVVLDGFDEVVMSDAERTKLLSDYHRSASWKRHIVVFTRPGVVPKLPEDAPMFTVEEFREAEQDEWLTHWSTLNQRGPTRAADVPENLRDLLRTPVLLFMVAATWHEAGGAPQTSAALYERFLRSLARGKLRSDATRRLSTIEDHNPQIDEAATVVLAHLRDEWKPTHPWEKPTREDAMLWILGRIALEMHRRGQETGQCELTLKEASTLIRDAIGGMVGEAQLSQVTLACVLTTHLGLRDGQEVMFFGHHSFQELLVARAWREQLRQIVPLPSGGKRKAEERVLEGLIIQGPGDKTIHFLMELLRAEAPSQQVLLRKWAKAMVEDLHIGSPFEGDDGHPAANTDSRAPLALAAFAIGGTLSGDDEGFVVNGPLPLRRVLAWGWLSQSMARLVAPRLRFVGTEECSLNRADFSYADLSFSDLSSVDMASANLNDANFMSANLSRVNLSGASLYRVKLTRSDLSYARLWEVQSLKADLSCSTLVFCNFSRADLSFSDLSFFGLVRRDLFSHDFTRCRSYQCNFGFIEFVSNGFVWRKALRVGPRQRARHFHRYVAGSSLHP
ncbi:pentapeptide repeat-containing protein [Myxococcota bacterium]|nr:pentapeptide repeat-containing protein [Myxococcota bacterium]